MNVGGRMKTHIEVAKMIREEIEADFIDRLGLGQEWDQIDDYIQDEIRETWEKAIASILRKRYGDE